MAMPSSDTDELAKFGYKQELDRSLGLFSSFAAGFSYISIMTGVFELFFFGFGSGGPAFIWTWPAVFVGQFLVALCFAELAGQYPLAGSVYQWAKQIARPFTAFFGGWILSVGAIVSASTRERLRAAEAAGTMDSAEAQTLTEAFGFIFSLRLDHQVEQLRRGSVPDDFIDPKTLNPLARSYLREAFRAVASVQGNLSAELSLGVRWG